MTKRLIKATVALAAIFTLTSSGLEGNAGNLERIRYNHPGLEVDLGVGLWAVPLPVDYHGNGRNGLLVSSAGRSYGGIRFFLGRDPVRGPIVFLPGTRVSPNRANLRVSHHGDEWLISSPGMVYPDFKDSFLAKGESVPFEPEFHTGRSNQWSFFDFNGNGVLDLIIGASDWREYGWDDAFDREGNWTNGPLRAFVWWVENLGTNGEPRYGAARKVMAGDRPVEVYGMPSPNFADFNGNGLPDLICGEFLDRLTFFENTGTRQNPVFAPGRFLKHGGEVIRMDLQMIQPSAIDWDGDGNIDLVVGEEDGRVAFLKNTGKVEDGMPVFLPPVFFRQLADEVKVGALATPVAFDWNGNGRQDLICGNTAGYLMWVENLGGYPPRWAEPRPLEAGGEVIRIMAGENGSIQGPAEAKWGYTVPTVADWNNNGLPDIIVNSIWGRILWFENMGTRTEPKLAAARPIEVEWEDAAPKPPWNWWDPRGKELVTQWRSSVQAIDATGNGLTDLVALDQDGYLALYERRESGGRLRLMPPRRVFFVEPDAPSVFDHNHRPLFFDTNGDGRNDLEGVDGNGRLAFYGWQPVEGGREVRITQRLKREGPVVKEGDLKPLRLSAGWAGRSGRRKFMLADWTGNGRLDLLVNSQNITLLENIARKPGKFVFREVGPLDDLVLAGHTTSPAVVDWNENGIPDLLVGAEDGYLYYKRNPGETGLPE